MTCSDEDDAPSSNDDDDAPNPTPYTLHPTPYTLHPTPHPPPYTPHMRSLSLFLCLPTSLPLPPPFSLETVERERERGPAATKTTHPAATTTTTHPATRASKKSGVSRGLGAGHQGRLKTSVSDVAGDSTTTTTTTPSATRAKARESHIRG